jgi:hypothetical protein
MSIQSLSFWQQDQNYYSQSQSLYAQDQNYWSQAQAQSQASSADASLINVMGTAETNEAKGLASLANQTALNRVNSQISALVQQALQSSSGSSSSSSSTSSDSSSSSANSSTSTSAASSPPTPATGTGTVRVTTGTPLSSLGILPGGTITISAGDDTTTYTSTGSDTVGDLINAINVDLPTNADVSASLNRSGQLVITSRNTKNTISIGGIYASNIGFGVGNNSFSPVANSSAASSATASTNSSSTSSASSAKSTSTASSASSTTSTSSKTKTALPSYLALSEQGVSTAAGVLSADGVSGSLVDLLA